MKKNIITLVALVVVLGGALAAFLLLQRDDGAADETSPAAETIYVLGGVPQPFVRQVNIRNELDTFTVYNENDNAVEQANASANKYSIDGVDKELAQTSVLKSVVTTAGNLTAKRVVAEKPDDYSVYGLAEPRASVECVYDGGSATIAIGDDAPGGEGIYVRRDDTVYLVASSSLNNMLLSRLGFVTKTLTGGSAEQYEFDRVTLSGHNFPEPVVIQSSNAVPDNEQLASVGYGLYHIVSPITAGVDTTRGLTPLGGVFGMTADLVVSADDAASRAKYGLADPYLVTAVETGDEDIGSFTLSFSAPDAEGNLCLVLEGRPYIYQIAAERVPWLDLKLFDYQEKMLILPHIDSVSQIDVRAGDEVHTFVLEGEGDDLKVTLDGGDMDAKNFRQFYQTLIAASYDSEIEAAEDQEASPADGPGADGGEAEPSAEADADEGEPQPEASGEASGTGASGPDSGDGEIILQYTYRYRDGKAPDVVTFFPGPARKALVRLNDGPVYYARSVYVDRVLEDLPKVLAGEAVKSYL